MPRAAKKKSPRGASDGAALAAGTAAVASILGSIAQAIGRAEHESLAAELRRQRDRLLAVLSQLQAAYSEERIRRVQLRYRLNEAHWQIEDLQRTVGSLRGQNLRLEQELAESSARDERDG